MKNRKNGTTIDPVICLDTNVLLRAFVREDSPQFRQATGLLEKVKKGEYEAIIPGMVLAEIAWVLQSFYKVSKEDQVDILNAIFTLPNAIISDRYLWPMASQLFSMFKLKYVDAVLLSLIGGQKRLTVLATFDSELLSLKIKGLNIVHPRDL